MKANVVSFVVITFLFSLCGSALAIDKTIDKRIQTDADGNKYYVIISSREGTVGHAFVTWAREDRQRRVSIAESYGFYPSKGSGAFGVVPGSIRDEALNPKTKLITDRLIVRVNRSVYESSQSARNNWATSKYFLYTTNCISFTMDVGRQIGLTVPGRGLSQFPSDYVQKLIRRN